MSLGQMSKSSCGKPFLKYNINGDFDFRSPNKTIKLSIKNFKAMCQMILKLMNRNNFEFMVIVDLDLHPIDPEHNKVI